MTDKRLIEEAFPLKQASLDSVNEKYVRHGHISTQHIWPARRPLAASRAALIAALLPDPGDPRLRADLMRKIGGELVEEDGEIKTRGGVLRWGRESTSEMDIFRDQIKKAFGGRAPKVMDMFAGGGALPLEAMRLGCDVTAIDYNPVAWFILKCTLEYPAKMAGKRWQLPSPIHSEIEPNLANVQQKLSIGTIQPSLGEVVTTTDGDLADHVSYWGNWVAENALNDLEEFYPTYALNPEQSVSIENPLCKTLSYLWTRTVPHPDPTKNGLQVPLLKTLWLCKKPGKRRALKIVYNANLNEFEFEIFVPQNESEVAQGTMSRTGVTCPPTKTGESGTFFRSDYLQKCGREGKIGLVCTAVVVEVERNKAQSKNAFYGKEFRRPTLAEISLVQRASDTVDTVAEELPFGLPTETIPYNPRRIGVQLYGMNTYTQLFTPRQLLCLVTFAKWVRRAFHEMSLLPDQPADLTEAVSCYLASCVDRAADMNSTICTWNIGAQSPRFTFTRYAIPMTWDFYESGITNNGFVGNLQDQIMALKQNLYGVGKYSGAVTVLNKSALDVDEKGVYDIVATDPPYYDAIPYSDISNFFYVWLRRMLGDVFPKEFSLSVVSKAGELVADRAHTGLENTRTFLMYEEGMAKAFDAACKSLTVDGTMVIVFAHKEPAAWETLVAAMIRAGFVVNASWPIDTERAGRINAVDTAALSSSVWLVCRKRSVKAGKGWYKQVQPRMKERITERLRYFWDEGVRGPDFLWAALGPGLEAFSAYDEVRRNDGSSFTISEFIKEVRRLTTDFALGQILDGGTEGLDDWTRYALMHAQSFGTGSSPVGEAILLAGAYGLDLNMLTGPKGILTKGKGKAAKTSEDGDETSDEEATGSGGTDLRLLYWEERKRDDLGEPLESGDWHVIDAIHRLMREWASGDVTRAAIYADRLGLGNNDLFWRVAQAFVEMGALQSKERSMLEAIISWGRGRTPQFTYASNGTTTNVAPQRPSTLTMDFNQE